MNFDWNKFQTEKIAVHTKTQAEKIAVHTKTQEEYDDFIKQAKDNDLIFENEINYYKVYGNLTCIDYDNLTCIDYEWLSGLKFSTFKSNWYKANNYTILEWSDYMNKELKEEDLKAGYVVKFDNDKLAIVAPVNMINRPQELAFIYLNGSCDICDVNNIKNIKEVYGYSLTCSNALKIRINERPLIWKREEPVKKVTMAEVEEKFGCKVKIVKEN